jgi:hypothetical protein
VLWHHAEPLTWEYGALGSGQFITVPAFDPAGMTDAQLQLLAESRAIAPGVTDLGSIPRAFRWFAAPDGPGVKAFCLHDYLYITRGLDGWYTRAQADWILLEAMLALGVDSGLASVIYDAVRLGGGGGWGR